MADKKINTEETAEKEKAPKKASAPKAPKAEGEKAAPKKATAKAEGEKAAPKKAAAPKAEKAEPKAEAPKAAPKAAEPKVEKAEPKAEAPKAAPKAEPKAAEPKAEKAEPKKEAAPKAAAKKEPEKATSKNPDRNRLKARYKAEVIPQLMKERGYKNPMEVPGLEKIVINMRIGDIKDNSKSIQLAVQELESITGQKCIITKAKNSIANFKLRENQSVGIKCTLRGDRMYEFLDKLVSIALPRVRDFRGISSKSFDGRGNYSLGIKEQLIFPEISYEKVEKVRGFDISIVTTAKSDDEARLLLAKVGMPFKS